ncbi:hypothetical protein GDO81_028873, partial [Engystomops pustulosus]
MECLVGLIVNMMIVAANFLKWKSQRSLQTCDKILSYLAVSRGFFYCSVIMGNLIIIFVPQVQENYDVKSILYIQIGFTFNLSQWIASVLCVFYCVKIVSYNCALCVPLRSRISTVVPWLVAASLIMSFISNLPLGWYSYDHKTQNVLNGSTDNTTGKGFVMVSNFESRVLIFVVGSFPPFVIFCAANSLLIHFLLIHTRRMRNVTSQNLRSHFGALKSMSLFLVLQMMIFMLMGLIASGRFSHLTFLIHFDWIILCFPLLFHSFYLFFSSSELRKMFVS